MKKILLLASVFSIILACKAKDPVNQTPKAFLSSLPQVTPKLRAQFSTLDTLFLQHLAYNSIVLQNGNFVLGDRQSARLYLINAGGKLINVLSRKGKGPGEFMDVALNHSKTGGVIVFDQINIKAVIYNNKAEYVTEFTIEPFKKGQMVTLSVYPANGENQFIVKMDSWAWYSDEQAEPYLELAGYNSKTGNYSYSQKYNTERYARQYIQDMVVGGHVVPYTPLQIVRYHPQTHTYFLFWTNSNAIAEVSAQLDTVRSISVHIPRQAVSEAEMDTVGSRYPDKDYPKMEELVPEYKTPVKKMFIDEEGRIWLQLNYRGEMQKWVILDKMGEPQKIVNLPKGMVTHVSIHHIGVRLNASTFALFEPVE